MPSKIFFAERSYLLGVSKAPASDLSIFNRVTGFIIPFSDKNFSNEKGSGMQKIMITDKNAALRMIGYCSGSIRNIPVNVNESIYNILLSCYTGLSVAV